MKAESGGGIHRHERRHGGVIAHDHPSDGPHEHRGRLVSLGPSLPLLSRPPVPAEGFPA